MIETLLTVGEVAAALKIHEDTVLRWIKEGKLRAVTTPGGGEYRIGESDLKTAMEPKAEAKANGPKGEVDL